MGLLYQAASPLTITHHHQPWPSSLPITPCCNTTSRQPGHRQSHPEPWILYKYKCAPFYRCTNAFMHHFTSALVQFFTISSFHHHNFAISAWHLSTCTPGTRSSRQTPCSCPSPLPPPPPQLKCIWLLTVQIQGNFHHHLFTISFSSLVTDTILSQSLMSHCWCLD